MKTNDVGLIDKAVESLREQTGFTIEVDRYFHNTMDATGNLNTGAREIPLAIECKKRVTIPILANIRNQFVHLIEATEKGILIADYINPVMAERLKAMDIWFLDTVGNAYINALPVYIYIKGNKSVEEQTTSPKMNRAFSPMGLKVVFALLCHPDLVKAPYRDIAQTAGVALGTVGWVFRDLIRLGHIIEMKTLGRRLKNRKKLLERWLVAYPEQLRPKLVVGRYRAPDPDWWQTVVLHNLYAYWGGEVAADRLTNYLKPQTVTIYAWEKRVRDLTRDLIRWYKLRRDQNGDIEILKAFWDVEHESDRTDIVNPILIYADLMATGDPRNIETAQIIYERELAEHFREN
ncbi:type IV toxin-antitoxin system AbiEi family antitoxin [Methylomarinum vadi]|uniref:type IV toxin-antitoxin system AbiEi family antitoxin n=1 Tax=Methylomarinum vadi TaxID=438855 RepID=UPI00068CED59|nr:type IV toxin-antitoxin system AbiEi family antitoxin [Methylomarinum vadi]